MIDNFGTRSQKCWPAGTACNATNYCTTLSFVSEVDNTALGRTEALQLASSACLDNTQVHGWFHLRRYILMLPYKQYHKLPYIYFRTLMLTIKT